MLVTFFLFCHGESTETGPQPDGPSPTDHPFALPSPFRFFAFNPSCLCASAVNSLWRSNHLGGAYARMRARALLAPSVALETMPPA